jgi:hypothetical protein
MTCALSREWWVGARERGYGGLEDGLDDEDVPVARRVGLDGSESMTR